MLRRRQVGIGRANRLDHQQAVGNVKSRIGDK